MTKKNVVISVICLEIIYLFSRSNFTITVLNNLKYFVPDFILSNTFFISILMTLILVNAMLLINKINVKLTDWYFR